MEEFGQSPDAVVPEGRRFPLGPQAGPGLSQRRYPCMRESLVGTNIGKCLRLSLVQTRGGWRHGGSAACVSPRRGRPQRGPACAGTPAGVVRSFVECANRTL